MTELETVLGGLYPFFMLQNNPKTECTRQIDLQADIIRKNREELIEELKELA